MSSVTEPLFIKVYEELILNFSVVIIWLIISFRLCENQNEYRVKFFINLQKWDILDIWIRMAGSFFIKC